MSSPTSLTPRLRCSPPPSIIFAATSRRPDRRMGGCITYSCPSAVFAVATVFFAVLYSVPPCLSFQSPTAVKSCATLPKRTGLTAKTVSGGDDDEDGRKPFVVDRVDRATERLMKSVSDMCIEVFFNEGGRDVTPWKGLQLAYLRHMQYSDLRFRTLGSSKTGDMFVAREVLPVTPDTFLLDEEDLIKDDRSIRNADLLKKGTGGASGDGPRYVRGDILGFVEVIEKRFGLGEEYDGANDDSTRGTSAERDNIYSSAEGSAKLGTKSGIGSNGSTKRPFLSNLSVRVDARRSGVGSALVEACEEAVLSWPEKEYAEIVLQVEEDNPSALNFYEKRGYKVLFADPACRRFDTSGWLLKQVPTTKVAMRKRLKKGRRGNSGRDGASVAASRFDPSGLFERLRDAVLVQS